MRRCQVRSVLICIGAVLISLPAAAATTYTNQASFFTAMGGAVTTEDFESYSAGTVITNQLTDIALVTTDGDNGSVQAEIGSIAGLPFPMTNGLPTSSGDRFLSSELASGVFASAGLNFMLVGGTSGVGFYVVDGSPLGGFKIDIFNGAVLVDTATFGAQTLPSSFIGLTSTQTFDSFAIDSLSDVDSWGIDDLSIGTIPEPGTALLVGFGLVGMAMRRQRGAIR